MDSKVLSAFGITGEGIALAGGQNESMLYDGIVLKPVGDERYYGIVSAILDRLKPEGYRISRPCKTKSGGYVEGGFGATLYEAGSENNGAVKEKLELARALHRDLADMDYRRLPLADDPWGKAHKVIWWGQDLPQEWPGVQLNFFRALLKKLEPCQAPKQIIHSDLAGNILFHETLPPLVIDFSPTIAPASYAEAILVCDSIAWLGQDLKVIDLLGNRKSAKPYIQRAILFRVLVSAFLGSPWEDVQRTWQEFEAIWQTIMA